MHDQADLRIRERDRHRGLHARTEGQASIRIEAGRYVDCQDRRGRGVQRFDDCLRALIERPTEARAEEPVDDDARPGRSFGQRDQAPLRDLPDRTAHPLPAKQVRARIARNLRLARDENDLDRDAAAAEVARDDERVASVVSLAGDHEHSPAKLTPEAPPQDVCGEPAGALHQRLARRAPRDGIRVHAPHLVAGHDEQSASLVERGRHRAAAIGSLHGRLRA